MFALPLPPAFATALLDLSLPFYNDLSTAFPVFALPFHMPLLDRSLPFTPICLPLCFRCRSRPPETVSTAVLNQGECADRDAAGCGPLAEYGCAWKTKCYQTNMRFDSLPEMFRDDPVRDAAVSCVITAVSCVITAVSCVITAVPCVITAVPRFFTAVR